MSAKKIKIGPDVKILFAKTILQLPLNIQKNKK
jgi:hypothetical protein